MDLYQLYQVAPAFDWQPAVILAVFFLLGWWLIAELKAQRIPSIKPDFTSGKHVMHVTITIALDSLPPNNLTH
jgi:hypothetical protein